MEMNPPSTPGDLVEHGLHKTVMIRLFTTFASTRDKEGTGVSWARLGMLHDGVHVRVECFEL